MKNQTALALALLLSFATAQAQAQTDTQANEESISKMQQRIVEIEMEMQDVEISESQKLGEEAFALFGEIDQSFYQLKNAYQQQVVQLNQRMQRKWEEIDALGGKDREAVNRQLVKIEKDWERTFERLTKVHQDHLQQLKDALAKVRGEFAAVAGQAQAELEATNFEARARWEKGHEILLAANRTYVKIVGDQIRWLEKQLRELPDNRELESRLTETRTRYAALQGNLQKRLNNHVGHLTEEMETRVAQLDVTRVWESRRAIYKAIDSLSVRTHSTYADLQNSLIDSAAAVESEIANGKISGEKRISLKAAIHSQQKMLNSSYLSRVGFIENQCKELERRIVGSAKAQEKTQWTATITDLRLLARDLQRKASELKLAEENKTRTAWR